MIRNRDPFVIRIEGGSIKDRELAGYSDRRYEGTGIPAKEIGSLNRVIEPRIPRILLLVFVIFFTILGGRVMWLQIAQGDEFRTIAEGNRIRLEILPAQRGLIVDRQNKKLVSNTAEFNLIVVPADLPKDIYNRNSIFSQLQAIASKDNYELVIDDLDYNSYQPKVLYTQLNHNQALTLMSQSTDWPGVEVKIASRRDYTEAEYLSHVLGYMSLLSGEEYKKMNQIYQFTDSIGRSGIEAAYEEELRGIRGKREVEVDNLGRTREVYASVDAISGDRLTLTIDSGLQQVVVDSMNKYLKLANLKKGAAVALDPKNGDILALASFPLFNPNNFGLQEKNQEVVNILQDGNKPLFNRSISGEYPAGSTIKPFIAAAALQEKIITPQTTIMSTGGLWAGNKFFADWKAGGHGLTNVYSAIADSVNTFFYTIGGGTEKFNGLGIDRLASYLKKMNFGQLSYIDLTGESKGLVPTPEWKRLNYNDKWYLGDTYNLSIGQGQILVTPLQLAVNYAALINNGDIYQPHLIKMIQDSVFGAKIIEPQKNGSLPIDPENLEIVKKGLRDTVVYGSGRSLSSLTRPLAGKTGTAQVDNNQLPHAWFVGFVPYEDPSMVLVILVENGGESTATAVPVAKEIFDWYINNRL
ncbi:MAG: penicillin-binding protein 2 [Patescibacteria group bacterium]